MDFKQFDVIVSVLLHFRSESGAGKRIITAFQHSRQLKVTFFIEYAYR